MKNNKRALQLIIGIAMLLFIYLDLKATAAAHAEPRGHITIDSFQAKK